LNQSLKKAGTNFDLTHPCIIKLLAGSTSETRHLELQESKDLGEQAIDLGQPPTQLRYENAGNDEI